MPPLADTVGSVTGASRGIGRQIALTLADHGPTSRVRPGARTPSRGRRRWSRTVTAEQVAYLAGPHARHVTAQETAVDAGGTWY